jgi:hypothetical protein
MVKVEMHLPYQEKIRFGWKYLPESNAPANYLKA